MQSYRRVRQVLPPWGQLCHHFGRRGNQGVSQVYGEGGAGRWLCSAWVAGSHLKCFTHLHTSNSLNYYESNSKVLVAFRMQPDVALWLQKWHNGRNQMGLLHWPRGNIWCTRKAHAHGHIWVLIPGHSNWQKVLTKEAPGIVRTFPLQWSKWLSNHLDS